MHMFDGGFNMGGMHALWWLFWLMLVCIFLFYGWSRPSHQRRRTHDTPYEMLRRRLASGEVTPAQYEERKTLLDRDAAKTP